jgi:hypothetical protein
VFHQRTAKRLIGEDARKVVDAAVALGLADHGDDLVGSELTFADAGFEARSILHGFQLDLGDFNSHSLPSLFVSFKPSVSKA